MNRISVMRKVLCAYIKQYHENLSGGVDNVFGNEFPVNRTHLPAATVGYAKIKVRSLGSDHLYRRLLNELPTDPNRLHNIPTPGTDQISTSGQTEYQYYTARDYPVLHDNLLLDAARGWPRETPIPFAGVLHTNDLTGSQGFSVETNNMHGKQKAMIYYSQGKDGSIKSEPLRKIEYLYKTQKVNVQRGVHNVATNKLVNHVTTLVDEVDDLSNPTGAVLAQGDMGITRQVISDKKISRSVSMLVGADLNSNMAIIPAIIPFPVPIFSGIPDFEVNYNAGKLHVTNKVIHRNGILEKVIVNDGQSTEVTENLVYHPYTGQPVLTSKSNLFDQPVYDYHLPEFLHDRKFGPLYWNDGLAFDETVSANTDNCADYIHVFTSNIFSPDCGLHPGDLCYIVWGDNEHDAFITILDVSNNFISFATEEPVQFPSDPDISLCLVRSSFHNTHYSPWANIKALADPTVNYTSSSENMSGGNLPTATINTFKIDKILDASIYDYSQNWRHYKSVLECYPNVRRQAYRDVPRQKATYKYNISRNYDSGNPFMERGVYNDFVFLANQQPYFHLSQMSEKWIAEEEITHYSINGQALEAKNALGIYKSAIENGIYPGDVNGGIGNISAPAKTTSISNNSRYYEQAFTSFEDHEVLDFGITLLVPQYTNNYSHFDLYASPGLEYGHDSYNILGELPGSQLDQVSFIIDKPWENNLIIGTNANVFLTDFNYIHGYPYTLDGSQPVTISQGAYKGQQLTEISLTKATQTSHHNPGLMTSGRVVFQFNDKLFSNPVVQPSSNFAHTGQRSLPITQSQQSYTQKTLKLVPGKTYHFTCWVNDGDENICQKDLNDHNVEVSLNSIGESWTLKPSGKVIEDWQRIDGDFVFGGGDLSVGFHKGNLPGTMYVDDVRIMPQESQQTSYVYDHDYLRLQYALDENNYFSKYAYDGEGNLISTLKETERGLKSINETKKTLKAQ